MSDSKMWGLMGNTSRGAKGLNIKSKIFKAKEGDKQAHQIPKEELIELFKRLTKLDGTQDELVEKYMNLTDDERLNIRKDADEWKSTRLDYVDTPEYKLQSNVEEMTQAGQIEEVGDLGDDNEIDEIDEVDERSNPIGDSELISYAGVSFTLDDPINTNLRNLYSFLVRNRPDYSRYLVNYRR